MLAEFWQQYELEGSISDKEKLMLQCLPMVKAMAQRFAVYASSCCDVDDLVSVGIIGLLDAVEKYNPAMQASFRTYAKYRIRGAILDEIRNLKWIPRSIQEKIQNLRKAYIHLEQTLSRSPTEEEVADALGMDLHQLRKTMVQVGSATLLTLNQDNYVDNDERASEIVIEDPNAVDPAEQLIDDEKKSILIDAINSLPNREATVISLYYYEEMTMKEIGKVLSLTESRICQIHASALLNLFHKLSPKAMTEEIPFHHEAVAD